MPEHRRLIGNIVESLKPSSLVEIDAPLNVETVITEKDDKIFIHLVTFNPIRQANTLPTLNTPIRPSIRMEEAAIYRASVEVKVPFGSAKAFYPETKLEVKGNKINILCERVYEVIIIEKK